MNLNRIRSSRTDLIGVPIELGANRPGIANGPDTLRRLGLIQQLRHSGCAIRDKGNIAVVPSVRSKRGSIQCKHLAAIRLANEQLCTAVANSLSEQRFPLIIGGDHSLALGSLAGAAKHVRQLGVIWMDAHGDLNTSRTTPSGNIHGMPLAAALGLGHPQLTRIGGYTPKISAAHTVLIGVRSLDAAEQRLIRELPIRYFTVADIRREGGRAVIEQAMRIAGRGTDGFHVSFDLDVLDPKIAPGVSTPVAGGITYREAKAMMQRLCAADLMTSVDFVELNPSLDRKLSTARLAQALISELLCGHSAL